MKTVFDRPDSSCFFQIHSLTARIFARKPEILRRKWKKMKKSRKNLLDGFSLGYRGVPDIMYFAQGKIGDGKIGDSHLFMNH